MKVLLLWKCAICVLQTLCSINGQPEAAPTVGSTAPAKVNGQNEAAGTNDPPTYAGSNEVVEANSITTQGPPQSPSQPNEEAVSKEEYSAKDSSTRVGKKAGPPFWILPKNDPSNAELMAGWKQITMESQLPLKFCSKANAEETADNQDISSCDYMAFAVIDRNYKPTYLCVGDENPPPIIKSPSSGKGLGRSTGRSLIEVTPSNGSTRPGEVTSSRHTSEDSAGTKIMVHTEFTDKCLIRFQFASATGHLVFSDQQKTSFWAINPKTRVLEAVVDENSATAFEMFQSMHSDAILLRGGPYFLSLVAPSPLALTIDTTLKESTSEEEAAMSTASGIPPVQPPPTPGAPPSPPPPTPEVPPSTPPPTPGVPAPPVASVPARLRMLDAPAAPTSTARLQFKRVDSSRFVFASNAITSAAYLLPPTILQSMGNVTAFSAAIDAIEARVLGYRLQYLKTSSKLLTSTWMAYDLSLLILLKRPFNVFQIEVANAWDLSAVFRKAIALVTEKLLPQYSEIFPSLGKGFPKAFSMYAIASSRIVVVESPQVWQEVASEYVMIHTEKDPISMHLGATIFAQAMMQDFEEKTSFFTDPSISVPDVMAVYYRSSCALAFFQPQITLVAKLNLVQFLTNRFEKFRAQLILPNEETGAYWFSNLLTSKRFGMDTSEILIDLGLLRALDPTFVAEKTNLGDRISSDIFQQMNGILQSSNGIDIRRIGELVESFNYEEVNVVIGQVCAAGNLRIELCVLPLLLRQIQNMRGTQNSLLSPNITTDLTMGEYKNYEEYLQLVVEDKRHLQIGSELATTIQQFNNLTFELGNDISDTVAQTTMASMAENSKSMAKTSQVLNQYLSSESKFRVDAFNSRMLQKLSIVNTRAEKVKDLVKPFLEKLRQIAKFAMVRAVVDLAVNLIYMVFQIIDMAMAFRKGGSMDIGTIGGVVSTARDILANLKTVKDTVGLIGILIELSTQLVELGVKVQNVMPLLIKIRVSAANITDSTGRNMSTAERQIAAETFLTAVQDYRPPLMLADINSLEKQLTAFAKKMCAVAQTPASNDCVTAPADAGGLFDHIDGIRLVTDELMQILYQHATEAVTARTRSLLQEVAKENEVDAGTLDPKSNDVKEQRLETFKRQVRAQRYKNSIAIAATLLNQFQITSALIGKCNREAYTNGGLPTNLCQQALYSGNPVADTTLLKIMSSRVRLNQPTIVRNTATIPTMPSSNDDLAYIDIPKLMTGEPHYFQLSSNVSWLMSNNWIQQESDLTNFVSYFTKLRVKLPVFLNNCLTEQCQMTVVVQSMPISDLGPSMKNKKYRLSPRLYKTEFEQVPRALKTKSATCENVEYQNCDSRWPQYCFRSHGLSDASALKGLNPSMFSEFAMVAEVETSEGTDPLAIAYQLEATPFSVYVDFEVLRYTVRDDVDSEDIARKRTRRLRASRPIANTPNPTASVSGRCCAKGSYLGGVNGEQECRLCPKGTFSRFGGLFCAGNGTGT
uniref:AlNc14C22G2256 protein n=1 Tax=Albugo laibachii Nc14 TaxID=890382 RepID=F0W5U1_9STRA|nr:AlNc14C22G2256 [Albugo laibachii Nc14]|eukprot:CCA16482.1 AlNc14C22G2256 [Albugo laibachii Nc14]